MLNETNIRCFLSLAKHLNFTKTAKELYMTQQSVSQHISRLERDLGFQLFLRDKHSVVLTMAGHRLFNFFSRVQSEYQEQIAAAKQELEERSHRIYIGYQNWMDFGPASEIALQRLQAEIPDLDLVGERYGPGELQERLCDGRLDMVLKYGRFSKQVDGLEMLELMRLPIVILVAPQNPLVTDQATYRDFIHEPYIFDTKENTAHETNAEMNRRVRQEVETCGLDPVELIPVHSRDSAYTAAEMGKGIVITTKLSRIIRSSPMKMYPTDTEETVVCLWHSKDNGTVVERFGRILQQVYQELEKEEHGAQNP